MVIVVVVVLWRLLLLAKIELDVSFVRIRAQFVVAAAEIIFGQGSVLKHLKLFLRADQQPQA